MQTPAEKRKQNGGGDRSRKSTGVDPHEVLRAATSAEGMPVEWVMDRLQTNGARAL